MAVSVLIFQPDDYGALMLVKKIGKKLMLLQMEEIMDGDAMKEIILII